MHGVNGEDGTIQGLFELADIPYSSASVLGSSLSMDKVLTKKVFESLGLPVLPYFHIYRNNYSLNEVTKKIVQKKIDQLPVVSVSGRILGMINQQHLIQAYVDFYDSGKN